MRENERYETRDGYLDVVVNVFLIRLLVAVLAGLAVLIAAVPIFVLIDLLGGGTGYGLCPEGIESCANPYSAAPELAVVLTLLLFSAVLGIRLLMRLARRMRDDAYQYQTRERRQERV